MFQAHHEGEGECSPRNGYSIPDASWQLGGSIMTQVRNTLVLLCFDVIDRARGRASNL